MKAVYINEHGGVEKLIYGELPTRRELEQFNQALTARAKQRSAGMTSPAK